MSNEACDYLRSRLNLAHKELKSLIQLYSGLNDDVRMSHSKSVFYEILSYIQIQSVVIFPLMEKQEQGQETIKRSKELHSSLKEVIDRSTMIHVDEPDNEYLHQLKSIDLLLESLSQHDERTVLVWMETNLSVDDVARLLPRLKEHAMQESLPSF
jgi:phenylalanine-4-hydroxylase